MRKISVNDIYIFKYANLDGTGEHRDTLNLNAFIDRDFYGMNLETNSGIDYEPLKTDWDIVFTKYMSVQPDGTPYPVTGVLSNDGIKSKSFHPVPLSYGQWWVNSWDSLRSSIGYDWKSFDMNTFTYTVEDSLVYFVRSLQGDVYKLIFTKFEGSSTGVIVFMKAKVSSLGINNNFQTIADISVYPNPARQFINISLTAVENSTVTLNDLTGSCVIRMKVPASQNKITLDASNLCTGMYILTLDTPTGAVSKKVIISR
jgi:hypothetical protein